MSDSPTTSTKKQPSQRTTRSRANLQQRVTTTTPEKPKPNEEEPKSSDENIKSDSSMEVEEDAVSVDVVETENDEVTIQIPERSVMPCNQPEKIVLVVDTAVDENFSEFHLADGVSCTPLVMLKRGIEMFVLNKNAIDRRHQFALVVLNENAAIWILDFTNDVVKVLKYLQGLRECNAEDIFDLNSVFDVIEEEVSLDGLKVDSVIPPAFVVRVILFYARSYTLPELTMSEEVAGLLNSPYFTFDVLMTHEPPSADNNSAKIAKVLREIDIKGFGYFFSVARNAVDLFVGMAKLLSHPLQRPVQSIANYRIEV